MAVLYINCSAEAPDILRDVIAEDDRAHGRLPRSTLAHQEHLSLLLSSIHHVGVSWGCR